MSAQAPGFLVSPAMCRASSGPSLVRRAGRAGARGPDSSSPGGGGSPRHGRGDRAPQSGPGSRRRCAARSTVRWESPALGPLSARAAAGARVAGRSLGAVPQAPAWGRAPRRRLAARPRATATPSSPTLAPGGPPRASSGLAGAAPPRGGGVLTLWVIQRVSCLIREHCSVIYAILTKITLVSPRGASRIDGHMSDTPDALIRFDLLATMDRGYGFGWTLAILRRHESRICPTDEVDLT